MSNILRDKKKVPESEFRRVMIYLKNIERSYLIKLYLIKLLKLFGLKEAAKSVIQKLTFL